MTDFASDNLINNMAGANKGKGWSKIPGERRGWQNKASGERVFVTQLSPAEKRRLGKTNSYESFVMRKNGSTMSLAKGVKLETALKRAKSYMRSN